MTIYEDSEEEVKCERTTLILHEESLLDGPSYSEVREDLREFCMICNRFFANSDILMGHINNFHQSSNFLYYRGHEGDKYEFVCKLCKLSYPTKSLLFQHVCNFLQSKKSIFQFDFFLDVQCQQCEKKFWSDEELKIHCLLTDHKFEFFSCNLCSRGYTSQKSYQRHLRKCKQNAELDVILPIQSGGGIWNVENLMGNAASIHKLQINSNEFRDPDLLLILSKDDILASLKNELSAKVQIKYKIDMEICFERETVEGKDETCAWFGTGYKHILQQDEIEKSLEECIPHILSRIPEFNNNGSSWVVSFVKNLVLKVVFYQPIRGGSKAELPLWVSRSKSVVNLNCPLNDCFALHILYKILNVSSNKGARTVNFLRKHLHLLSMGDIEFPMSIKDICKFERLNPTISVNCYYCASMKGKEESHRKLFPLRISEKRGLNHIDLLVVPSSENVDDLESSLFNRRLTNEPRTISKGEIKGELNKSFHFCLINNLSRLLHPIKESSHKTYICRRCLLTFYKEETYLEHEMDCSLIKAQRIELPKSPNNFMEFSKHKALLSPWYVVYADFECLLQPETQTEISLDSSSTHKINSHYPFAYAFVVIDFNGEIVFNCNPKILGKPSHAGVEFLKELRKVYETILQPKMEEVPLLMTKQEVLEHDSATECKLCQKIFQADKTAHHDHKSGRYIGAYCNDCNLKVQQTKNIIVLFHNSRFYDTHILFQGLAEVAKPSDRISVIPQTREKYIGFQWNSFMFLDSLSFLNCSLEKLAGNLQSHQLKYLFDYFKNDPQQQRKVDLLKRKGVFPYSYLTHHSVLDETKLPSIDFFYNDLSQEVCTESDYAHAKEVYKVFQCKSIRDYVKIYLISDNLLLCCVFEEFRKMAFSYYGMEVTGFFTLPGFAFEAALKMTKQRLELLTDPQMYLMIEMGILGGISVSNYRFLKANNKDCSDYDPTKPTTFIQYLDINNLYGKIQSGVLPIDGFRWVSDEEKLSFDITAVTPDDKRGYILEVMLYIPKDPKLHEKLADFPPGPLHETVKFEQLSTWQQNHPSCKKESNAKLILDLRPEKKCVLHALTLKTYCELGLTFKILRGISFNQDKWLKPFIDFNTSKRKLAKNEFERSLFKLMNNSTFGKFIENQRNRRDVKIAIKRRQFINWVSKPNFYDFSAFSENFVAVELKKSTVKLNRPIACGFTTLCVSKAFVYSFFYKVLKPMFNNKIHLGYTDTDAYITLVQTENLIETLRPFADDFFDFSNLDKNHPLYSTKNASEMGFLKCEAQGKNISEFISLKSKMYCLTIDGKEKKVAKGVHRSALSNQVRRDHYYNALFAESDASQHRVTFNTIRSDGLHRIGTLKQVKLGITSYDDKRKILEDKINSVPFFFCGDVEKIKPPC